MKRLLSLLLTVLMLFTAVSVIPSASADTAPAFKEGVELAINDAVLYGAKLDYDDVRMGDVDLSGEADIVDVTYLQRQLTSGGGSL